MNMSKISFFSLILACAMVTTGCKKDEGPMGPQGPAGANGNANVQSEIITVEASEWTGSAASGFTAEKETTVITEDIAINGAVLCYSANVDSSYTPLPTSLYAGTFSINLGFQYHANGNILFYVQADNGATPQPADINYKVVAIESRMTELYPNISEMPYEDVLELLGDTE